MNYIELFAGCGGLSLGLKAAEFELVLANELSPMAAETYALNLLNEDIQATIKSKTPPKRTFWLSSNHPLENLNLRLREDPRTYPAFGEGYCDIPPNDIRGNLIVGSIVDLNIWLNRNPQIATQLQHNFQGEDQEIDLVSGGPPCQSFSMAGLRKKDCDKNSLPWEFAKFSQLIKPKFVLLENVSGILRAFKDDQNNAYYAWFELAKAFAQIGYIPLCLHVNAKYVGVPQNRPRFILLGFRADIYKNLENSFNEHEHKLLLEPLKFFKTIQNQEEPTYGDLTCRDVESATDLPLFTETFLRPVIEHRKSLVNIKDAIDDLRTGSDSEANFALRTYNTFEPVLNTREMKNHEFRANSDLVRRRFRLYQILQKTDKNARKNALNVIKSESANIDDSTWTALSQFNFLQENGRMDRFENKNDLSRFLRRHATQKITQKALAEDLPAPAALSIPDDACHYHQNELRTLTVREMARIQSFPDNFEFRSKVTTGGKMRRYEVPQYTQVGNAVPPLLGKALGTIIANLISRL